MQPIDLPLEGKQLVLLKPDEGVSTAEAYSGVHPVVPPVPLAQRVERPVGMWRAEVKNDFEKHIFESHPVIAQLKQLLEECGAEYAAMSGSGSAVYGIFASNAKVDEILKNRIPQGIFIHTEIL